MTEEWRTLLYPLGYVAAIAFGGRFLWQWIISEWRKESCVTPFFWILSLIGNVLLFTHSILQAQIHVCLNQACNGVISWRNLNLMAEEKKRFQRSSVLVIMGCILIATLGIYTSLNGLFNWFRVPKEGIVVGAAWHLIGTIGMVIFSLRFWIQWWQAERMQASTLSPIFFWLSVVGHGLQLLYFFKIGDMVNLLGPTFGMIPYIRNLVLLRKAPS